MLTNRAIREANQILDSSCISLTKMDFILITNGFKIDEGKKKIREEKKVSKLVFTFVCMYVLSLKWLSYFSKEHIFQSFLLMPTRYTI